MVNWSERMYVLRSISVRRALDSTASMSACNPLRLVEVFTAAKVVFHYRPYRTPVSAKPLRPER